MKSIIYHMQTVTWHQRLSWQDKKGMIIGVEQHINVALQELKELFTGYLK
jgi:hypothetical protein